MKKTALIILSLTFIVSCLNNEHQDKLNSNTIIDKKYINDTINKTSMIVESWNEKDSAYNEFLTEILSPIRSNYNYINSFNSWDSTKIYSIEHSDTLYSSMRWGYKNDTLYKITVIGFSLDYQKLSEYYLKNDSISLVVEKKLYYKNILIDTSQINNNQLIEIEKSYFNKNRLIHKVEYGDCGVPFSEEYLNLEENRILTNFDKLRNLRIAQF
jgi:hypothetical protein